MNRQEEAVRVAGELLTDIELKRLKASEIVLRGSRLARLVGHEELSAFLGYERNGYPTDGTAKEWIGPAGRWSDDDGKFYPKSISKIEASLDAAMQSLAAMQGGGNYSGDYIAVASREHDNRIAAHANLASIMSGICGQVVATVYDIVAETYHELLFSELHATLFADTRTRVDGLLAAASGSALDKIERVSDRLRDGDAESTSQALTTCRRLVDSCADFVFPARKSPYPIGDEAALSVGQQNVLNRLQAFTHAHGVPKSRRDRLRRSLSDLYSRCSAGTHAEVTVVEARFVFLQTYVTLGEILMLGDPVPAGRDEPKT